MMNSDLKNANILIVDDQQANIEILTSLLGFQGYENVRSTVDPREVLDMVISLEPDIILLDLMMPYLDGYEVIAQIKKNVPNYEYIPILVLTADISSETRTRALSEGAKDFLSKPFDLVEVGLRIKNLLENRYLHQQSKNQNRVLEEKVKERTKELEIINNELNTAKEKAERSDRLKTAFLNNISHEIRTPLNGILGFAPFILDSENTEEERNEYLEILNKSSDRLIQTVTDYMDISLLTSNYMEVRKKAFSPQIVLNNLYEKYAPVANQKNIKLILKEPAYFENNELISDSLLIEKVLKHLLANAIKFTKQGEITLGAEIIGNKIKFYVKDTGVGISDEIQAIMFENFMQGDVSSTRGYEGSGLGLSIVKGVMDLLGCKINVKSALGEGSTFWFEIETKNNNTSEPVQNNLNKASSKEIEIILVAEDDDDNFYLFDTLFEDSEFKIIRAENGIEAVNLFKTNPDIKLILMDLKMPRMNGFEATKIIKEINPNIPIIALTAYALTGDHNKAFDAGCDDYIEKPINKKSLLNVFKKYLGSE